MDGKFITYGILMMYLIIAAVKDAKTRQVSAGMAKGMAVTAMLLWGIFQTTGFWEWICGLLPGLCILLIGWLSREAIGYGDGLVTLICGLFLGFWGCMQVLVFSLFLSGPFSLFLITSGRAHRKSRIPFVPFIMLGYLAWLIMKV